MLERLKSTLYWQNFAGYVDKTDEYGNILGTVPEYGETQTARVNISAAKGAAEQEMFGALVEYDRTIAFKHTLDINETGVQIASADSLCGLTAQSRRSLTTTLLSGNR